MGELELVSVAAVHLALVQTSAVVGVDAISIGDEEDNVAGLVGVDVLVLLPKVADPLVAFGAPVALSIQVTNRNDARYVGTILQQQRTAVASPVLFYITTSVFNITVYHYNYF